MVHDLSQYCVSFMIFCSHVIVKFFFFIRSRLWFSTLPNSPYPALLTKKSIYQIFRLIVFSFSENLSYLKYHKDVCVSTTLGSLTTCNVLFSSSNFDKE